MSEVSFPGFESAARARGFDTVLERRWAAAAQVEAHTHPFDAEALVVQGELWLTVGAATQHLRLGDRFALERGVLHSERYGNQGATFWVARRNPAP